MKIFSDLFGFRLFYNCQKLDKLLMLHKVAGEFRSDYFPFVKRSLQIIKKEMRIVKINLQIVKRASRRLSGKKFRKDYSFSVCFR